MSAAPFTASDAVAEIDAADLVDLERIVTECEQRLGLIPTGDDWS